MKAAIRNTEIYFDIAGMQLVPEGNKLIERPVIFLVHGGPGADHARFKQHTIELQDMAQLVFIDHRGCGRSKRTHASEYTLENNIEDLEALRKHLGLEKIVMLGASYGGMVAQGYAIRYPQNLSKLILAATVPSHRFIDDAKKIIRERGTPEQIAACEPLWQGKIKDHKEINAFFEVMDSIYSTTAGKNKNVYANTPTIWSADAINAGFGGFLRTFDYTHDLHKITCPTLILAGDKDWICNAAHSKLMAEKIPNATLKIYQNSGHAIAIDAHDDYIADIKNFLTEKS